MAFFISWLECYMMLVMKQPIYSNCLSERPGQEDDRTVFRWADFWAHRIAYDTSAVSDMLAQLDSEPEFPDDLLVLFSSVLDVMRMNRENSEKDAAVIFELVEGWLSAKTANDSLNSVQKMELCRAFIRVGLEPPDSIRFDSDDLHPQGIPGDQEMPDIEELMRDLIPADVTGYPAYMVLREGVGSMPRGASALFVTQMVAQGAPQLVSLGRYCLLDPMAEMRTAAAEGFVDLAKHGAIDATVLSDLIRLRKWIPDQGTKSMLDRAIKEALRREATGGSVPGAWTIHRLVSSLPDGTGSQSILASVSRGSQKCIVNLLIKAGHGVKDAYAIPCTSASDQRHTLDEMEEAMPVHAVPVDYLPEAVAAAIGDGLAKGMPPAPGFVDAAQMLGLDEITPFEHGTVSAGDIADPQSHLDGLSAAKRGRLIGRSIKWARDYEMSSSWFATDATLLAKLDATKTEHQAEKVVWAHLDTRRDFWSSLFARSAAILRHAGSEDWLVFASVVQGLEAGRALKKTPIFEMIAALTLDVAEQGDMGMSYDGESPTDAPYIDDDFDPGIEPEASGELGRLLRKTPLSSDMINGYLTAIVVAPRFVTPTDWLPPLLGEINFPGGNKLQRVLDIIMLRYGVIQDSIYDGDIAADLRTRSVRKFQDWLSGFTQASVVTAAWPKRALSSDDRKILKLIKEGALDSEIQATLKPLLPSWCNAMALKAVDA